MTVQNSPALSRLLLWLPLALCLASTPQAAPKDKPAARPAAKKVEKHTNRLAGETSPYLLLHAHNPVDWYPWGPEALAKAKKENKLIFLSIGYSSCHWCHVMERESFVDEDIAAYLNENFVAIKVDREERPDIDEIYMTALQVYFELVGSPQSGGWPMSMFLTPEARPFAGGTYFPPRDSERGTGFETVLNRVQELWAKDPDGVRERADKLTDFVQSSLRQRPSLAAELPGADRLDEVQTELADRYDPEYGGFGYSETNPQQPKFPQPASLAFLLDRHLRGKDKKALAMLTGTLDQLVAGGIRDHLGGGFHRYSTDRLWRIPHFEKMLYDNAQLATVFAAAWKATDRAEYREAAEESLDFILRDLADPAGGFYAALDAESDGEEGTYYSWDRDETRRLLSDDEYDLFAEVYGLAGEPNFEGRYVLYRAGALDAAAKERKLDAKQAAERLASARRKLLAARDARPKPRTDTKILTSWNGLAIRALADAGAAFADDRYAQAAARTADFVLGNLRTADGRLQRTYGNGQARLNAYLDDYAYTIDGLLALHGASGDARWLQAAEDLTALQDKLFWDEQGGYFYTSSDHEELIARSKEATDSATPSPNALAASNALRLAEITGKQEYRDRAKKTILAFAGYWEQSPASMPSMALALAQLHADTENQK